MIPRSTMDVSTVESNFDGEKINMTIDENSLAHIMSVLTDLYSDTMLAVIREYSTNARDTHIEAGKADVPIEVSTPNQMMPMFRVKDQGVGLSLDDIRNIYSKYGASTKRGSDAVNGMLGLGAKAALTYTSSFTVVAVKGGVKNVVSVGRNEDGSGYMEVVDTLNTDQPNGVEIQVPVSVHDAGVFANKIREFFKYWEAGTVSIDGVVNEGFDASKYAKIDDRTYMSPSVYDDSIIVMGGVSYPVPFETGFNRRASYVYFADIGDAVFSPSRESLLTNKKNRELCDSIRENIKSNVISSAKAEVASAGSRSDAVRIATKAVSTSISSVLGWNHGVSAYDFEYDGKPLSEFRDELKDEVLSLDCAFTVSVPYEGQKIGFSGIHDMSPSHFIGASTAMRILDAAAIVTGADDPSVISSSHKRTVVARGLRELGYTHKSVLVVSDSKNLSSIIDNSVPVIQMSDVRKASSDVLKRTRSASPKNKKANPKNGVVDVITSVSGVGTMSTEAQSISGDGSNLVYLSRSDVRVSGTVSGSSAYSRSARFSGVMEENSNFKFVAVTDKDEKKFLDAYPKAVSFREFVGKASKEAFVDKMVSMSDGKFTKDDVFAWGKHRRDCNLDFRWRFGNPTIPNIADRMNSTDGLFFQWKRLNETNRAIEGVFSKVCGSSKSTFSEASFDQYLSENEGNTKSLSDIESEIGSKYPILSDNMINGNRVTKDALSHLVLYVKAVDSGIIS